MKAIKINEKIKTYPSIPNSFKVNGKYIAGGGKNLSKEKLTELGFYDVITPETKKSEQLGDIYFDEDAEVFTYPVESRTYSQTVAELKEQKIGQLKSIYNYKLATTDWYVIRKQEKGTAIPTAIQTERDDLRTACSTHETSINAKTTKASIVDYVLPNL